MMDPARLSDFYENYLVVANSLKSDLTFTEPLDSTSITRAIRLPSGVPEEGGRIRSASLRSVMLLLSGGASARCASGFLPPAPGAAGAGLASECQSRIREHVGLVVSVGLWD